MVSAVSDGWRLVLYLHLLSMAFFVGGQLVFCIAVVPLLRGEGDRDRLRAGAGRFGYGSARRPPRPRPQRLGARLTLPPLGQLDLALEAGAGRPRHRPRARPPALGESA